MGKEVELTDSNFAEEVTNSAIPVLVDFWAEWCQPCRMIAPSVEEIAQEYEGKIKVGKLNVDHNQQTAARYGIMSIPTLILFKGTEVVTQVVGAQSKNKLVAMISKAL
jgi:thioredoxin 1